MMAEATALRVAIDLIHVPSRVRHVRLGPLPDGVLTLLQVAAGDERAIERAIELTARSGGLVRDAAVFFIEQILLLPGADSYRVLGASPDATSAELRRNMILLLKWLHPDMQRQGERSVFAGRVASAWSDLKTPERRAAYDEARRALQVPHSPPRKSAVARGLPATLPYTKQAGESVQYGRRAGSGPGLDLYRSPQKLLFRRALLLLLRKPKSRRPKS